MEFEFLKRLEQKVHFDISSTTSTSAGSAVYAWEVCHRLMRLSKPLQVTPFKCPFKTIDKTGFSRAFNATLRDLVWRNFLFSQQGTGDDYFIFPSPSPSVPKEFYKRRYALVVHDLGAWHNPSYLTWRGRLELKGLPDSIRNADRLFVVSKYTAHDVANEFSIPQEKIIIAPNGLSEIYKNNDIAILSQVNGFPLREEYILHIGTFEPKKNLIFLLKIYEKFRQITASKNTIKLVLTGGESWRSSEFRQALHNSPYKKDILVLGRVTSRDLPGLYKGAIALVFPSIFEGFGIPVIEALSQQTPVLVNANSSLTEFGQFGATVIDNFDVDIWVNTLQKFVDSRMRVDPMYVQLVKTHFDWDRTANIIAQAVGV